MLDQTIEDWRSNFTASVESVFVGCREAMRIMVKQGSGSIVNVSSVSSLRAGIAAGAYSASRRRSINSPPAPPWKPVPIMCG